jgi:large subunit ribosomal protein L18
MKTTLLTNKRRERRRNRVRSGLRAFSGLPRLAVTRTLKHISAQVIDDARGVTLAYVTTTAKALSGDLTGKNKTERAKVVGSEIARKAKQAGIERVVFDRGHCRYHGRVKALADAAREGGLQF